MTSRSALQLPEPSMIVLGGPAGSGKSRFADRRFAPAEVLSSDEFRGLVAGDPADQSASSAAFSLLRHALDERMKRRRLTVIDATNITRRERRRLVGVARRHDVPAIAIAFALPLGVCRHRAEIRRNDPWMPTWLAGSTRPFCVTSQGSKMRASTRWS